MDQDLLENQPKTDPPKAELEEMSQKIDEINRITNRTYKIILWTAIATAVLFILPLIALAFVIPYFLKTLTSITGL
ncbi:MAG: hypothetical protein A2359_03185 [Candidatus Moranbacteria bacterium RIFOXYB1_FULL_43_19]|nr:MAG: hypothetical protein A2451_10520 [Bdellovibrionales bacterium RIFOXYC2_FULL_39_8]OGI27683.1 MAG: hypothetical protein A2359_03185 [Candidatus Moranbacteria bacterium RIFOXYB1_FULL_43_19]OGI28229.1 MAG: hypothetical protein A2184_03815 [Candidatus Moranbacteria bacterium RIFOXYA1_FULL_44_7]OGI33679.1 MAG: hypothetical protein A2420_02445 [Candidatus Moranbacteria bacterium RIFOXYC1_FULL_44_13]OGI37220.1 MAG: hypothetical protein A2612_04060 [Candidatus Moranbacteria bacterium RIFOXYD1_FU